MRWWLALTLTTMACSVVVEPPERVRCDPPGARVCGPNSVCGTEGDDRGYCIDLTCMEAVEICDRIDNDCDGAIDEELTRRTESCNAADDDCDGLIDEGLDMDGDGFTPCGTTDCTNPDGDCRLDGDAIDCNDGLANVNPAAPEICDSIDHNCDAAAVPRGDVGRDLSAPRDVLCAGMKPWCEPTVGCVPADCTAPRPGAGCGAGQACDPTTGACVGVDCSPESCGSELYCSSATGNCEPRLDAGSECSFNFECKSDVCSVAASLGVDRQGTKFCVEACCTDFQCPSGSFCWDAGTGTRSCVPLSFEPALHGRQTLGSGQAGSSCTSDAECRSGRCSGSFCVGACRSPGDCAGGSECTYVRRRDGRLVQACFPGLRSPGDYCGSSDECPFTCEWSWGALGDVCTYGPCATNDDCPGECDYTQWPDEPYMVTVCRGNANRDGACCSSTQCPAGQVCRPSLSAQPTGTDLYPMFCDIR